MGYPAPCGPGIDFIVASGKKLEGCNSKSKKKYSTVVDLLYVWGGGVERDQISDIGPPKNSNIRPPPKKKIMCSQKI